MKKMVLVCSVVLCLFFAAASTAHAQYWPSSSYSYHFFPGGGSYNYSWYQHAHYGPASVSYNYGGPYGSWYWYQNYPYQAPVYYYPMYPSYQYHYYNAYWWWHYHRR